ncbi:MAG: ATP-grasp domain-containing protein [Gemmatimonadota bacterium]|nr:ATP-grasp domain-containing protein [Gemmatimonadota bacterium]
MTHTTDVSPPDDRLRVLVTGAGGAAAISVLRSLTHEGHLLFAGDVDPHAAGLYLVGHEQRVLLPRGDDPDFAKHMAELCRSMRIEVLIPTVDSELIPLAEIAEHMQRHGTRLVLADLDTLRLCLDKLALARACEDIIPAPRSAALDPAFDSDDWTFPFIVKPRSGSGGRGVRLVRSERDLAEIHRDGSHLVQEYLPGEEYSVDVFADQDGQVRATVPRVRLKVDSGVAVAARTVHDPELEAMARAVAQRIGLRFVANIQFRRDERGRLGLLEVNPRFPGTMPLTVRAGVDMPHMALLAVSGWTAWPTDLDFAEVAVVRHWEEVFLPVDALELSSFRAMPTHVGAA